MEREIILFLVSLASGFWVGGLTVTGWRHWLLYGLAAVTGLAALSWHWVSPLAPALSSKFAYVAGDATSWFVLLMFLTALLIFCRPAPRSAIAEADSPEEKLMGHIFGVESRQLSVIDSLSQNLAALSDSTHERLSEISGDVERLSAKISTLDQQLNTPHGMFGGSLAQQVLNVVERQNELEGLKDTLATLPAIRKEITKLQENHFQFSDIILKSLRARDAFALAKELNDEIIAAAQVLDEARSRPLSAHEWVEWRNNYNMWLSRVRAFCNIARPYDPEVNRIEETPAELYRPGHWTFDTSIFPDGDAVHDFQSFRIVMSRYNATGPEVLQKMTMHSRV